MELDHALSRDQIRRVARGELGLSSTAVKVLASQAEAALRYQEQHLCMGCDYCLMEPPVTESVTPTVMIGSPNTLKRFLDREPFSEPLTKREEMVVKCIQHPNIWEPPDTETQ